MDKNEKTVIKHVLNLLKQSYKVQPFLPNEILDARNILEQMLEKGAKSLIKNWGDNIKYIIMTSVSSKTSKPNVYSTTYSLSRANQLLKEATKKYKKLYKIYKRV